MRGAHPSRCGLCGENAVTKAGCVACARYTLERLWPELDAYVRDLIPWRLDVLGFPAVASRLRTLAPVTSTTAAEIARRLERELRLDVFTEAERDLRQANIIEDELERAKARRNAQGQRYDRAGTLIGIALGVVCTAATHAEGPEGKMQIAIALREIEHAKRILTK